MDSLEEEQKFKEQINSQIEKKSVWRIVLTWIVFVVVVGILFVYWIVPFRTIEFNSEFDNSNFTLDGVSEMQFYKKMRYPSPEISYRIYECNIAKTEDAEEAFAILEEKTVLEFEPAEENEEISVTCDEKTRYSGNMFVAGEGGPSNITKTANYNVITHGEVLLIRNSDCATPNVAIHELLHALGFDHSENQGNIMYPITECGQEIGEDTIDLINELYAEPTLPDLSFEEIDAKIEGVYLEANVSVRNNGLKKSGTAKIEIYANDNLVKAFDLSEMEIGVGNIMTVGHLWVSKLNVDELRFVISADFEELDKKNNERILKINN